MRNNLFSNCKFYKNFSNLLNIFYYIIILTGLADSAFAMYRYSSDCESRRTTSPHRFPSISSIQSQIPSTTPTSRPKPIKNAATNPTDKATAKVSTTKQQVLGENITSPVATGVQQVDKPSTFGNVAVNLEQTAEYSVNYSFLQFHSQSKGAESEREKFRLLGEQVTMVHPVQSVQEDLYKDVRDLKKIISTTMCAALYVQKAFEIKNWNEGTYERVKYNFITAERGFRWLNQEKADFIIDDNFIDRQIRILMGAIPQVPHSISWQQDEIICLKTIFKYLPEALGDPIIVTIPFPQNGKVTKDVLGIQKAANERIEIWKNIPCLKQALFKVPYLAGEPKSTKKKEGLVWKDSKHYLRINRGAFIALYPYQQVDHVLVMHNNKVIGCDGQVIEQASELSNPKQAPEAHIPLIDWLSWKNWYGPGTSTSQAIKKKENPPLKSKPLTWFLEKGNPSVQLHPSLRNSLLIEGVINKLDRAAHFKDISFSTNKGTHLDGLGFAWSTKDKSFGISLRMGDETSPHQILKTTHIKIFAYNRVVDKFGKMISVDQVNNNEQSSLDSHIPIIQWLRWPLWFSPTVPLNIKELQTFLNPAPEAQPKQESFPVDSQQPKPLITPLPGDVGFKDKGIITEEKKPQVETLPVNEQKESSLQTPIYDQNKQSILILEGHEKEEALKQFDKIYGEKVLKIKKEPGHVRIHTELSGGFEKAQKIFEELTGRKVKLIEGNDKSIVDDFEINLRERGKSAHPKIEIKNIKKRTYEKITFK